MKKLIFLLPLVLFAQNDKVVEEIVKGKAELRIEGTKRPKMVLRVMKEAPVDSLMEKKKVIKTTGEVSLLDSLLFLSLYTPSPYLRSPFRFTPPCSLKIELGKDFKGVEEWEFVLLDSKGKPLFKVSGDGKPEEVIYWNGVGDDGRTLMVGEPMTPVLNLTMRDRTKRIVMDPVKLKSFMVDLGDSVLIKYTLELLFDPRSDELVEGGKEYIEAVLNVMKELNSHTLRVRLYSRDFRASTSWKEVLSRYIKSRIPLEELGVVAVPLREGGKRYERVEFSILKK